MTHTAMRVGSAALIQALRTEPLKPVRAKSARPKPAVARRTPIKRAPAKRTPPPAIGWTQGVAVAPGGARRYWLYKPPGVRPGERLPLLVMLHGCLQDAQALAASSRMNRIAARERFLVLYPEQDRMSNSQTCWNWYETRSGRAQGEAGIIESAIDLVCRTEPVDTDRIALAGLSAGASMAALLATRRPARFRAVAMHSGIAPGVAQSPLSALKAMRGRLSASTVHAPLAVGKDLPALLVIQGSVDRIVAPSNGGDAASMWAARAGARASTPRIVQRGTRYATTITDYRSGRRVVATLCEVRGLGHAWSGGAAGKDYSDPAGPDASRLIWAFAARQFAL